MKITLDLPDWIQTEGRGIFVMAGIETVAIKLPGQQWEVKTGRCSYCGRCCEGHRESDDFPAQRNGVCEYLTTDGPKKICSLGLSRPFACSVYRCAKIKECTQKFEVIK